ncbi:hypothetical protein C7S18_21475 [Ahniella affigens]|uniref:Uncharacterized protein n=1 Tax=Ahniella affigens TaxID=2021234 RepID=A0A2P1PXM0_9GAMM|nr:TIR domain-containing protein [Ahniella affigens]AVP99585.1 hypothetical protein C7S18_21475 [Ahniella affigens]
MTRPGQIWPPEHRPELGCYAVAFSFAGEDVEVVRPLAEALEQALLPGEVFFDEFEEHKLFNNSLRNDLSDLYLNRAVLVVRCLSQAYSKKPWCQAESVVIAVREKLSPHSVLDIYVTDAQNQNLAGQAEFLIAAHLHPQLTLETIMVRLRDLCRLPPRNPKETRSSVSVFVMQELSRKLSTVAISRADLVAAVDCWPAPESAVHSNIDWWLSERRAYPGDDKLVNLLHGLWPKIHSLHHEIQDWFLTYLKRPFPAPPRNQAKAIVQWHRERVAAPKESPKERHAFFIWRNQGHQASVTFETSPSEASVDFKVRFPDVVDQVGTLDQIERVELAIEIDQFASDMPYWSIQFGLFESPLSLAVPTNLRSLQRARFKQGCAPLPAAPLCKHEVACVSEFWVNDWPADHCLVVRSLQGANAVFFNKLIMSARPVAMWSEKADLVVSDEQWKKLSNSRTLPTEAMNFAEDQRRKHAAFELRLFYEDHEVPLHQPGELNNRGLDPPL